MKASVCDGSNHYYRPVNPIDSPTLLVYSPSGLKGCAYYFTPSEYDHRTTPFHVAQQHTLTHLPLPNYILSVIATCNSHNMLKVGIGVKGIQESDCSLKYSLVVLLWNRKCHRWRAKLEEPLNCV